MFSNKIVVIFGVIIGVIIFCNLLQVCWKRPGLDALIGSKAIESRVDKGTGFRREFYVYSRGVGDAGKKFDLICSKISAKYSDGRLFNSGVLMFENGKLGHLPDISKWFDAKHTVNLTRYYSLRSKDHMSVVDVYETENYVCIMLADGW